MELYLQFGHGMMDHCRVLISRWGGGTVLLSPRDLKAGQLSRMAADIRALPGGSVLLDPQFYLPHADHKRLCGHGYWPKGYETGTFWQGAPLKKLVKDLSELNGALGCRSFVLPGLLAPAIDDDWMQTERLIIEEAAAAGSPLPLIATVALSADALRESDPLGALLDQSAGWPVAGYYVVCEHVNGSYLVGDPNWLANVLDLAAGLRLQQRSVILGYCNHQMLAAAAAGVTAIASGTWMNVRSFPPEKFKAVYEDEIKQRATWYYCPQALSEYKIPFLDIAHRFGVLEQMAPPLGLDGEFAGNLFAGGQPSSVGLSEQSAFRHYLTCLRGQVATASRASFGEAVAAHEELLTKAEALLETLAAARVSGQLRDFREIVDVNRAALAVLDRVRGAMLRRKWSAL
jgi:hypothetical protein